MRLTLRKKKTVILRLVLRVVFYLRVLRFLGVVIWVSRGGADHSTDTKTITPSRLVNAVRIGEQNLRVIFTVRDYVAPERERTAVHCIDNIDFQIVDIGNPPVEKIPATSGLGDGGTVSAAGVAGHPVTTHPFKVRLSQILGGKQPFLRGDEENISILSTSLLVPKVVCITSRMS